MRLSYAQALLLAPWSAQAIRIVMSNDDGWAAKTVRVFYDTLTAAGQNVVLSGPAENKSGSSSLDVTPTTVDSDGCEYSSCPPGSPPTGANATNPRLNYVNSYPVTAMKFGIQTLAQPILGGAPELALSGINAGTNGGAVALISGTVGAACEAAKEGIPAIAFSGTTGEQVGWETPTLLYQTLYSDISLNITEAVIASGTPYLPSGTILNVNFPAAGDGTACTRTSDFQFIFSRVYPWIFPTDTEVCGTKTLPSESGVFGRDGCYVSLSVMDANTKLDVPASTQKVVYDKLAGILSCLPSNGTERAPSSSSTESASQSASATIAPASSTASSAASATTMFSRMLLGMIAFPAVILLA